MTMQPHHKKRIEDHQRAGAKVGLVVLGMLGAVCGVVAWLVWMFLTGG